MGARRTLSPVGAGAARNAMSRILAKRPDLRSGAQNAVVRNRHVIRQSEVCVIMPTSNQSEVTAQTILQLLELHEGSSLPFDILLVDNGSEDYRAVARALSEAGREPINWILLEGNGGSSGAQNAGIREALEAGYQTLILTDNDAVLTTPNGIDRLLKTLDRADIAIPRNTARFGVPANLPFEATLHYVAMRAEVVRSIGSIEPFFFLCLDDVEFFMRALSAGLRVVETDDVQVRHPLRKPVLLSNRTTYLMTRNYLHLLLRSPVAARFKVRAFLFIVAYLAVKIIHAAHMRDLNVLSSAGRGLLDGFRRRLSLAGLPASRFAYEEVKNPTQAQQKCAAPFSKTRHRVILHRYYRVEDTDAPPLLLQRIRL